MQMVTYYRVDLETGITVEERASGLYRDDPDYGRTVFKNLRKAKAAFAEMSRAEMRRLRTLQRQVRPLANRSALKGHSFSPEA